ncbi:uncharacterized protein [Ptychodera flava]|uniref:uncharacterized protein n=1 Tax=Ptychodera flava TaxID=63121 RepID=UPI00396A92D2
MDHWEALGVCEVKMSMFREGVEKASMVFNGICSTKMSWLSQNRLKASPWQDLMDLQQGTNNFSISGRDGGCIAIFVKHKFEYIEPNPTADQGWELVFKAVPGVGGSVFDLWNDNNGGRNQDNIQAKQLNANYRDHYKSPKVDSWSTLGVREVKLSVYEDGEEKMYMIFDGRGIDKNNWLSKERLISTPYLDLLDADVPKNYFSLSGDAKYSRRFFIHSVYGGCPNDVGWFVVVDPGRRVDCGWSFSAVRPFFLYSKIAQRANYITDSVGRADFMAIHIKTY